MTLTANVSLNGATDAQTSSASWVGTMESLSVAVDARELVPTSLNMFANAFGSGGAYWVTSDEGSIGFKGLGWQLDAAGVPVSADLNQGDPNWSYAFVADVDDVAFSMDFQVIGIGDLFGLQGWEIRIEGGPEGLRTGAGYDVFDPTRFGTFTAGLTAGQTYTVSLVNNAYVADANGSTLHGAMNSQFLWHIDKQAVPEPGSAALAALALLALRSTRRRA